MNDAEILDSLFQQAVDAIDAGDAATLERLLAEHPQLVKERLKAPGAWLRDQIGGALDSFYKDPYLLWFVTEDAVRTGRLSPNVVEVARTIIDAAKRENVDTLPEQLETTIHFAVCSPVGRNDGLQIQLIDALLDGGASPEHTLDALVCRNPAALEHLLERGAKMSLPVAVCTERMEEIAKLGPAATTEEKQIALAAAALNGKAKGLTELIKHGVVLDDFSSGFYTHATPLHHAVNSASLAAVKALAEAGAKLDTKDLAHHATPLHWAEYGAKGDGERASSYTEIADYLRSKGAPA